MLTFYKIDAKHAHHRSPPQYINTSQYIQQRPNTIYRIGCQLLRIANTQYISRYFRINTKPYSSWIRRALVILLAGHLLKDEPNERRGEFTHISGTWHVRDMRRRGPKSWSWNCEPKSSPRVMVLEMWTKIKSPPAHHTQHPFCGAPRYVISSPHKNGVGALETWAIQGIS